MTIDIGSVLKTYDLSNLTIAVLGGHSALDVCRGAKLLGFKTLAVCEKGRSDTYTKHYATRTDSKGNEIGCVDEVIEVERFADVVKEEVQEELRKRNALFVHNRYFWVYCDFDAVEKRFNVPIIGNREYVRLEERDAPNNQYELLEKAGIRIPRIVRKGGVVHEKDALKKVLDEHFVQGKGGPLIVKVNEAIRGYERAFFVITTTDDYFEIGGKMIDSGFVNASDLDRAVIEEFIIGAQVNFNYFYCPLTERLELMGTDMRRQTSLDGFLRLDAKVQTELLNAGYKPSMVETGHVACTVKESLVEKAFKAGEKFVEVTKSVLGRSIVGPFALQGAVASMAGKEEIVIFDVSMRIPGSPGTASTPYSGYLYGEPMSFGERIAMAVDMAGDNHEELMKLLS